MDIIKSNDEQQVTSITDIKKSILDIFSIAPSDFPEDKEIVMKVNLMLVPESIEIFVKKRK